MPCNLKMSQDVFQMKMDPIVERCSSILCIHNDLYVYDHADKADNADLLHLMQVARYNGNVSNSRRYQIRCSQITFYDAILSKEGMQTNPEKIQGIREMVPSDVQQLQSFLGMLHIMQPYIPHLSHHVSPLRELLRIN